MLLLGEMCFGFHWIKFGLWKSPQPIEYKVYTKYVILASLFRKRQRNKEKNYSFENGKGFTLDVGWEDSKLFPKGIDSQNGEILNSFLLDEN